MKFCVVHLSDIHFCADHNQVLGRAQALAQAVRAADPDCLAHIFLVSGDIANSGKREEYELAKRFFQIIKDELGSSLRSGSPAYFCFIPGNHDCDLDADSDTRRMAIDYLASKLDGMDLEGDLIVKCLAVQDNFFNFVAEFTAAPLQTGARRLFYSNICRFPGCTIRIGCYNSAWLSQRHEDQGKLLFPIAAIPASASAEASETLALSMVHHPYNWFPQSNGRALRQAIERSSDLVFTGHEHVGLAYRKEVLEGPNTEYHEGSVLQMRDSAASTFCVVLIETEPLRRKVVTYSWQGGLYTPTEGEWAPLKRNSLISARALDNNPAYKQHLEDVGTGFTHPSGRALKLRDLFIYPELERRSLHRRSTERNAGSLVIRGSDVVDHAVELKRVLIIGSDLSGRSSLAKVLYGDLTNRGLSCLMLSGPQIVNNTAKGITELVRQEIGRQYSASEIPRFEQLDPARKVLLIDDFDKTTLNPKGQKLFLDSLRKNFDTILLFVNEFFALSELSADSDGEHFLGDFDVCYIKEFGYVLRGKLVERWSVTGREMTLSPQELAHEVASNENLVLTVLGNNLLPSFPIVILTILQAWEANKSHDLSSGSFGYLYETLILRALAAADLKPAEMDIAKTFLSIVAYRLFKDDRPTLDQAALAEIEEAYHTKYMMRLPNGLLGKLRSARVLVTADGQVRFQYSYYYYFFTAVYFRDALARSEERDAIREHITFLAERVHAEDYANILTFYIYLTKDDAAIREVLAVARRIFDEFQPCDFDKDVAFVNELYRSKPILALPSTDAAKNREEYRERLDEAGASMGEEPAGAPRREKYDRQLSDVIKTNMAGKMLQIIGQIVKDSPGSLPGPLKQELVTEAYMLGLRTLKAILSIPAENLDVLRSYLSELIREHRALRRRRELTARELAQAADQGVIGFTQAYGFSMALRTARAIGLAELEEVYRQVLQTHPEKIAVQVIDVAIRLEHFKEAPVNQVFDLDDNLRQNYFAHNVLRELVFRYLYLKDVPYRVRHKLTSRLEIGISDSKLLENPSKRRRAQPKAIPK